MNLLRRLFRRPPVLTPARPSSSVVVADPLATERLEEIRSRLDYTPDVPFHKDRVQRKERAA